MYLMNISVFSVAHKTMKRGLCLARLAGSMMLMSGMTAYAAGAPETVPAFDENTMLILSSQALKANLLTGFKTDTATSWVPTDLQLKQLAEWKSAYEEVISKQPPTPWGILDKVSNVMFALVPAWIAKHWLPYMWEKKKVEDKLNYCKALRALNSLLPSNATQLRGQLVNKFFQATSYQHMTGAPPSPFQFAAKSHADNSGFSIAAINRAKLEAAFASVRAAEGQYNTTHAKAAEAAAAFHAWEKHSLTNRKNLGALSYLSVLAIFLLAVYILRTIFRYILAEMRANDEDLDYSYNAGDDDIQGEDEGSEDEYEDEGGEDEDEGGEDEDEDDDYLQK